MLVLALRATLAYGEETPPPLTRALELYAARHYSEARVCFRRLATAQPDNVDLEFYLGRLALWFDDAEEALARLEAAARQAPSDARVQNALGDAYGLMAQTAAIWSKFGWAQKCLAAYERAVRLAPANPAFRWSLVGYYCVAPRIAGGGRDKALEQAEAIRRLDPMSGRIALATLHLAEGQNSAAFAEFDGVLRALPDDFVALYQVGRCAALSGEQLPRGAAALRRCLELTPPEGDGLPNPASVHYRLGNILEKEGDRAGAEAEYAWARRLQPDFRADKIALKN